MEPKKIHTQKKWFEYLIFFPTETLISPNSQKKKKNVYLLRTSCYQATAIAIYEAPSRGPLLQLLHGTIAVCSDQKAWKVAHSLGPLFFMGLKCRKNRRCTNIPSPLVFCPFVCRRCCRTQKWWWWWWRWRRGELGPTYPPYGCIGVMFLPLKDSHMLTSHSLAGSFTLQTNILGGETSRIQPIYI